MSKKKRFVMRVFLGTLGVTALLSSAVVTKYYWFGSSGLKRPQALTVREKSTLAAELIRIARENPAAEIRSWLVKQTPMVSGQVILSLDNTNDPRSRVRLAALDAMYSLELYGLDNEASKAWAFVLRDLAHSMLHPGAMRIDYIAKSYVMEGRTNDAAAAYRQIPNSQSAKVFFGANPEFRSPASR